MVKCRIQLKGNSRLPQRLCQWRLSLYCSYSCSSMWLLLKRLFSPVSCISKKIHLFYRWKLKVKHYYFTLHWQARKSGRADLPGAFCDLFCRVDTMSSLLVHFLHTFWWGLYIGQQEESRTWFYLSEVSNCILYILRYIDIKNYFPALFLMQ